MYTVGCTHPAFRRLRKEDCELEASSDSTVRPRFKQTNKPKLKDEKNITIE